MDSDGYREIVDFKVVLASILSLGLWKRPWERVSDPQLPGVGFWDAEHFSPGSWKSHRPYLPFVYKDNFDMFWAAKIMMRLTPAHIRTAVLQGRLHDPRSTEYVTKTLVARQKKAAHYWFSRVNPLDEFELSSNNAQIILCFADLLAHYQLAPKQTQATRYHLQSFDFNGDELPHSRLTKLGPKERMCISGIPLAQSHKRYTIVRGFDSTTVEETASAHRNTYRG